MAGGHAWQWACVAGGYACHACLPTLRDTVGQCAGGTHPAGMHSCIIQTSVSEDLFYKNVPKKSLPVAGVLFLLILVHSGSGCYFAYLESKYGYYRTSCGLTQVPPDIPTEAKMVQLVDNSISNIKLRTFEHLRYCVHLSLSKNDLVHLSPGMFAGIQHLKELWLDSNSISDIEANAFVNLTMCSELHLADNKLSHLRLGMFDGLRSLKELWLDKNSISDIEAGCFMNLVECTELVLHTNRLTYLRAGMFDGLKSLKELWLHENNISDIEAKSFTHLRECTKLSLHHNKLAHLQSGMFDGLESLKYLELSYNIINSVEPATFSDLTQLVELNLYDNQLKTLEVNPFTIPLRTNLALRIRRNPLHCDREMCWIKQAEREGRIYLGGILHWGRTFFKPDCENYHGITWDNITLDCLTEGEQTFEFEFFRIEFYRIYKSYRICRRSFLPIFIFKTTKNVFYKFYRFYRIQFRKNLMITGKT